VGARELAHETCGDGVEAGGWNYVPANGVALAEVPLGLVTIGVRVVDRANAAYPAAQVMRLREIALFFSVVGRVSSQSFGSVESSYSSRKSLNTWFLRIGLPSVLVHIAALGIGAERGASDSALAQGSGPDRSRCRAIVVPDLWSPDAYRRSYGDSAFVLLVETTIPDRRRVGMTLAYGPVRSGCRQLPIRSAGFVPPPRSTLIGTPPSVGWFSPRVLTADARAGQLEGVAGPGEGFPRPSSARACFPVAGVRINRGGASCEVPSFAPNPASKTAVTVTIAAAPCTSRLCRSLCESHIADGIEKSLVRRCR